MDRRRVSVLGDAGEPERAADVRTGVATRVTSGKPARPRTLGLAPPAIWASA
ncbi:hypothetical protein GCM10009530_42160 [Microbispora corallina]|uniref:Uncharacterized protein n=1 Tax=Microbispora corallina TaxID=83302 RepID=A0ABQ4G1D4_9ACTN|nr:hypothetical protein Mco01_38550 [Microbispora corallina]